jgi:large subunit ribosomal protein L7/L12
MLPRNWSPDVAILGDRIAALTAAGADELNRYLIHRHGLKTAGLSVILPVPEPDVIIRNEEAEPAAWDVVLEGFRAASKIALIRLLREQTGLSLLQVRNLLEALPRVVHERLARGEAESLRARLETAGASATLRPTAAPGMDR